MSHKLNAVIEMTNLSKWYGQVIGVNDITLNIKPGVTGLLGPNGAGKTTLLKLMAGQLKPSRGNLTVFGEPIWNNPKLFHRIGFCPEQDAFYDRMSGLQFVCNLALLTGYSQNESEARAIEAIKLVDMLEAKDKKIANQLKQEFCLRWIKELPEAVDCLQQGFASATVYYDFPAAHHRRIHTTNGLERLNGEIKRRTKSVGVFPNRDSALRLVASVAIRTCAIWGARKYLEMSLLEKEEQKAA